VGGGESGDRSHMEDPESLRDGWASSSGPAHKSSIPAFAIYPDSEEAFVFWKADDIKFFLTNKETLFYK
jgi:hypothetical protein